MKKYLLLGLIASVFPDIDIFYFYLIDHKQNLHHGYWIHLPFYWALITLLTLTLCWLSRKKEALIAALIIFSNIFLHLILDTLVGKIEWLFPFTQKAYYLFEVSAVHGFWIYNFIFHWTFLFEIAAIIWAGYLLITSRPPRLPIT